MNGTTDIKRHEKHCELNIVLPKYMENVIIEAVRKSGLDLNEFIKEAVLEKIDKYK